MLYNYSESAKILLPLHAMSGINTYGHTFVLDCDSWRWPAHSHWQDVNILWQWYWILGPWEQWVFLSKGYDYVYVSYNDIWTEIKTVWNAKMWWVLEQFKDRNLRTSNAPPRSWLITLKIWKRLLNTQPDIVNTFIKQNNYKLLKL